MTHKKNLQHQKPPETFRPLAKEIYVSNDTQKTGLANNDLIIGPVGSGKTGGYVVPNMLSTDQSMVIVDTKGQLYKHYAKYLKSKGFTIRQLDFKFPELAADTYNPLDFIRQKQVTEICDGKEISRTHFSEKDILTVAASLLPECKQEEPFWTESSRLVLASYIAYVLEKMIPRDRNFRSVGEVFRAFNKEISKFVKQIQQKGSSDVSFFRDLEDEDPDSFAVKLYYNYRPNIFAEKCWGSISMFVSNVISQFDIKENASMLCNSSSFNLADLGREKTVLFVNVSDTDRSTDNLVSLLYTQLFQVLCNEADSKEDGRLDIPVRIILDDFASLNIKDFDKIISVIRSRQIEVSVILQSLSQLEGLYDEGRASTIVNNCDHLLYLGGQDLKTCEYIATKAGKLPETISKMATDHVYLFERGKDAIYTEKIEPYSIMPDIDKNTEKNTSEDLIREGITYEG